MIEMIDDCPWHRAFWERLKKRLLPLLDLTTWVLLILSVVPLLLVNRAMLVTLAQWCAFSVALAGVAVFLCRIMLPMIDLADLARQIVAEDVAHETRLPAAVALAAVVGLLAALFIGLVLWGKA